jgi:hypothetical protein
MSIIKTIHSNQYAQIHNNPLQNLEDLQAIGLLAHLMSLPQDWTIYKTQLQKKFSRRAVDNAFKVLQQKGYLVSIKHREGKKNAYKYLVSDIPITKEQIQVEVSGLQVMEIFSGVQNEQLKMNCSKSTVQNVHIQKKDVQKNTNKRNKNIINNKATIDGKDPLDNLRDIIEGKI